MLRRFTDHPSSVNETYFQHMGMAFGFGGRMLLGGLACLVHGLCPGCADARQRYHPRPASPHGQPSRRAAGTAGVLEGSGRGRLTGVSGRQPEIAQATPPCALRSELMSQWRAGWLQTPVKIGFQGSTPSEALTQLIDEEADTSSRSSVA